MALSLVSPQPRSTVTDFQSFPVSFQENRWDAKINPSPWAIYAPESVILSCGSFPAFPR
jgi:hypothetical protein